MWPEFGPQRLAPCWTTLNSPSAELIWSTPLRGAAHAQWVWGRSSERAQEILSASVPISPILLFYEWWRPQPTEANWLRDVIAFAQTDLILCFLRLAHWTFKPITRNNKVLWATSHAIRVFHIIFSLVFMGFVSLFNNIECNVQDRKSWGI